MRWMTAVLAVLLSGGGRVQTAAKPASPDAEVEAAQVLPGRALFLRGFPAGDELSYDALGKMQGAEKRTAWTFAGVDVKKVSRQGSEIEIEGVRVAIRYNPDNRQFERHPQTNEIVRIRIADAGDPRKFAAALEAIFAQGIDPRLQHETPLFWQHFFAPGLPWPADGMTPAVTETGGKAAAGLTAPVVIHKADARLNGDAERDKVRGTVQMRIVIDTEGVPHRIALMRPLGYGLDEAAAESVAKWRFTPAMRDGKPIAAGLVVNFEFQ